MYKPCPKCGGSVTFRSKDDQTAVQITGVILAIVLGIIAVLVEVNK